MTRKLKYIPVVVLTIAFGLYIYLAFYGTW